MLVRFALLGRKSNDNPTSLYSSLQKGRDTSYPRIRNILGGYSLNIFNRAIVPASVMLDFFFLFFFLNKGKETNSRVVRCCVFRGIFSNSAPPLHLVQKCVYAQIEAFILFHSNITVNDRKRKKRSNVIYAVNIGFYRKIKNTRNTGRREGLAWKNRVKNRT